MGAGGTFEHMARIALNGRLLVPGKLEGIGRFTLRTLERLVALRPDDQFLLVVDRPEDEMFHLGPNVEVRRIRIPARRPWLIRWWFGRPLGGLLRRWKADAFVSLEGPLATEMPPEFPQMTVIHDLNFEHRPEGLPKVWARYYRTEFPGYARRAQCLGTVSEFSKSDLVATYGLESRDIEVFSNAADPEFVPARESEKTAAQQDFAGGRPYWVFVGSLHPRKNLDGLFKAFQKYVEEGGAWDLVVVGAAMWGKEDGRGDSSVDHRVHFVGRLNSAQLVHAVAGAEALVFIPWFEGFGIPVVEAMACGVPVIASNVTSLPEVCGDAAFAMVDPGDVTQIASAMSNLERNPEAARSASERGVARAKDFSWDRTAELVSRAVDRLLETRSA